MRTTRWSTLLTLLVLFVSTLGFAQDTQLGGIAGTVRDAQGALVPGATVTIQNQIREGRFRMPSLIGGRLSGWSRTT